MFRILHMTRIVTVLGAVYPNDMQSFRTGAYSFFRSTCRLTFSAEGDATPTGGQKPLNQHISQFIVLY
jgi:hypothetical protein